MAIIGTERHESRRVDRQLRGRAGRQGDPGSHSSMFPGRSTHAIVPKVTGIAGLMDKMGHKDGDVIQHLW
ncbi:MAG: hypothetical protein R2778_09570 [Saprospiraceae bacterium]